MSTERLFMIGTDRTVVLQLAERFAELESLADAHAGAAKDASGGNRNANAVMHKVERSGELEW